MWGIRELSPEERDAMRHIMNHLFRRVRDGEDVVVDCHCKRRTRPADAPHGDIVVKLVLD
jgi:predicted deacylase